MAHVDESLWVVEDIFRTTKSILETRPIFTRASVIAWRPKMYCEGPFHLRKSFNAKDLSFLVLLKMGLTRRLPGGYINSVWSHRQDFWEAQAP